MVDVLIHEFKMTESQIAEELFIVGIAVGILIILLNIVEIAIILRTNKQRGFQKSHIYLLSLALGLSRWSRYTRLRLSV